MPNDQTIINLFEAQVVNVPQQVALRYEDKCLSYAALNKKANQLAHTLLTMGVQTETITAVVMHRSFDLIVAILAILKCGGAYLPIDPNYPEARINYMLKDSNAKIVLTEQVLLDKFNNYQGQVLNVQDSTIFTEVFQNPDITIHPENLAYVIYTSGTTGKPKGVLVEHKSVVNLVQEHLRRYNIAPGFQATQLAGPAFDGMVAELFPIISYGGTLHILPDYFKQDPRQLSSYLEDQAIDWSYIPPALLPQMPISKSPQWIILAGETYNQQTAQNWIKQGHRLENHYGLTEATVICITRKILSNDTEYHNIGHPIQNCSVYLLDKHLNQIAVGIEGELYIGGDVLARGYLNLPALSKERFIDNPYATQQQRQKACNLKLYKTGDICRYLANQELVFIGRSDNQVSINGYRVELNEIEQVLQQHPLVKSGIVLLKENTAATKTLIAYIIANNDKLDTKCLRSYLAKQLPEYMLPNQFIKIARVPLTANGKIDKAVLMNIMPEPTHHHNKVAPRNEIEQKLCDIWRKVLDIDSVGINDDFFHLGGNSLLITKMALMINQALNINIDYTVIFKNRTISKLSEALN